jgi:AraC-like DNA-binding protein
MPIRSQPAVTPIAFVKAIVLAYEKYGLDPSRALTAAQIPRRLLNQPDARITATQMETISATAMQELDDEALGWFSRRLPWGTLGMLCRASLTSPDLNVALKRWCRHHHLLADDIALTLTVEGAVATCAVEERVDLGAMREFCLVASLRNIHGYACWLIDSRIPLSEVTFPFAPPGHHEVYPLLFPGPIEFESSRAGFSFDAQYLAMPLRRDERALRKMLQRALLLPVLQYRHDRLLMQRVHDLLRTSAAQFGNAETIAGALHISTRTLHRRLKEEGVSLQQLKDEARRDHAIEQLCRTARPVKQIALMAGFRNEKSFARAFRDWTGRTPSEYRRREKEL